MTATIGSIGVEKHTRHGDLTNDELWQAAESAEGTEFFSWAPDWARHTITNWLVANAWHEREKRTERGDDEWILTGPGEVNHLLSSIRCVISVNHRFLRDLEHGEEQARREQRKGKQRRAKDRKEEKRARDREIRNKMKGAKK